MLAFQFHNQIARLRQFAFGLVALIVWSANDSAGMGLVGPLLLVSYPIGLHSTLRHVKVIADNLDRAFVLDALIVCLILMTQPLGLLSQIALFGGMAFTARLCLLPTSPSYQVIRLILLGAWGRR